jgi:hypothetical protein
MVYLTDGKRMSRRGLFARAALIAGGYLARQGAARATLEADRASPAESQSTQNGSTLSPAQKEMIVALCDTVLPATDTPGAVEARVDEFIAHMLAAWCSEAERATFLNGLEQFAAACVAKTGVSFVRLSAEARLVYIEPLDREAVAARLKNVEPLPFFASMKELTLIGYFTSEIGSAAIGYLGPVGADVGRDGPISAPLWN